MTIDHNVIKASPYFTGLSEAEIAELSRYVFEKKAERGEVISLEGEPAAALYTVTAGVVKAFKTSPDGKEQIFRIMRPGEIFDDAPVLGDGPNLVSTAAMSPVVLSGIKKADMEAILREYPAVALNVIRILSRRIQELVSLVEDFSFLHVTGRVAKMLLQYADHHESAPPRLTQQEMAGLIGTAREMVGRSLKKLEDDGAIRMDKNRIVIVDRESLKTLARVDSQMREMSQTRNGEPGT